MSHKKLMQRHRRKSATSGTRSSPHRRWSLFAGVAALIAVAAIIRFSQPAWQSTENHQSEFGRQNPIAPVSRDDGAAVGTDPLPAMWPGKQFRELDPLADGWTSELFSDRASAQLKLVAGLLEKSDPIAENSLAEVASAEFSCNPLRARNLREVHRDGSLVVFRPTEEIGPDTKVPATNQGVAGLTEALRLLAEPLAGAADVRVAIKVFSVEQTASSIMTRVYYQAVAFKEDSSIQQNATWHCRWTSGEPGDGSEGQEIRPELTSIEVREYEEIVARGAQSRTLFVDCTEAVFSTSRSYHDQLCQPIDYWLERIERRNNILHFGHHGLALGDVNGDGLDEVYLCQPGGLPNRLFVHSPDGTLEDRSLTAGVAALDFSRSALFVDLDNDGNQDLVVSTAARILFFAGDGKGGFTLRTETEAGRGSYSLAAADYDNDADLDLFACTYHGSADDADNFPVAVPYHDATNGGANVLLRNEGEWRFQNVTSEVGLDVANYRFSFSAVWEDYDSDGDIDLYVANDFGRNNLYRNDAGHFTDVAASAGVEDIAQGMSASFSDYNRDGRMDIYVGNMFSAAGNRVAFQQKFQPEASITTKAQIQRLARGNTLFANLGDGRFRDESVEAGVTMGRWSWSSVFADINNDGWDDLLVANGFLTGSDPQDL
jgi:hypothetical protein